MGETDQLAQSSEDSNGRRREELYREYEMVLSLFRIDVDIHYRRAQMTLALQTALLAGFAFKTWNGILLPLSICLLGIVLSILWRTSSGRQRQYMELRKRMLRDLEARLGNGINLFTVDANVFFHRRQHQFRASDEKFPDNQGEFAMGKMGGKTTKLDEYVSLAFLVLWLLLAVVVAISPWVPWISSQLFGLAC